MHKFFLEVLFEGFVLGREEVKSLIKLLKNSRLNVSNAFENLVEFKLNFCPMAGDLILDLGLLYPKLLELIFGQFVIRLNLIKEIF